MPCHALKNNDFLKRNSVSNSEGALLFEMGNKIGLGIYNDHRVSSSETNIEFTFDF